MYIWALLFETYIESLYFGKYNVYSILYIEATKPINTPKGEHWIGNFFSNIISNHVSQTRINSKFGEFFGLDFPDSDQN